MSVDLVVASFTSFFVTIDPVGVVPIFLSLTAHLAPAERRRVALRGTALAAAILVGFALVGEALLDWLGIGMPAFRIAGGLLLLVVAGEMLFERRNERRAQRADTAAEGEADALAVFPLAVPLLAGPAALTAAVLMMSEQAGDTADQLTVLATLLVVLAGAGVLLLLASRVAGLLGRGAIDVVTRLLGIVLAALAIQFVLDGVFQAVGERIPNVSPEG
ncbi:MAG: NAAT family transporter [Alphaproteobacteria bacterium]|nr:NAAT family transporter [Alphaproteobacteria bacterium]